MKNFLKPLIIVSIIKLILGSMFASQDTKVLLMPFVEFFVQYFENPWEFFYYSGELTIFPYGPIMLYPLAFVYLLLSPLSFIFGESLTLISFTITLLMFDIGIYFLLLKLLENEERKVFYLYFCSPIVIYINYFYTQLDIIPTFLILLSLVVLFQSKEKLKYILLSSLILGFAINAKFSSLVALVFIATYLSKKSKKISSIYAFFAYFIYYIFQLPFSSSEGFVEIVRKSSVQSWIYDLYIGYGNQSLLLLITPLLLGIFYLNFISYNKISRSTLIMYLALGFMSLVMFVSPSPGWYMWIYPFIVYCFIRYPDFPRFAIISVNGFYLLYFLLSTKYSLINTFEIFNNIEILNFIQTNEIQFNSLLFTPLLGSMIYIMFLISKLGNEHNNLSNYRNQPLMIGIGGDSGSGKDYTYKIVSSIFSSDTLCVQGDDDHKWERGHQKWKAFTHLNPKANNLYLQFNNTKHLKNGRSIYKSHYDHSDGKFSNPSAMSSSDIICFLGLHVLYLPQMRGLFDLKIFLDPEERLRQKWKIERDHKKRGYSKEKVKDSIAQRNPDSQNYIRPQLKFSDLIVRKNIDKENIALQLVIKNKWDLSYLIDYIESDKNQDYKFNHYFDYNNDSQIIELNGEFSQDFFNKYIGYMKDSLDFINKDFGKNMSSNDLLIQVTILTMLSGAPKK
tara:strand:+ start:2025 stop:4052 length:2028 start_codon:yes stop_codon:yes gene_type:complete